MLIKPLQGIGTDFIGLILHWSRDNSFIWKYFNTHHVWIMSWSTGTNQAMNLVLSVQSPISWGLLIDKCCVLCMGIVIFVLQLGLTFFFPFKYIYVFNFYIFFNIILIQIKRDHFQFILDHDKIVTIGFENVPKWGQYEIDNKICRPNGRSMTAATALMDFPFSFQQEINWKPMIHYTEMLTRMLLGIMCEIYVYSPYVIQTLCYFCIAVVCWK